MEAETHRDGPPNFLKENGASNTESSRDKQRGGAWVAPNTGWAQADEQAAGTSNGERGKQRGKQRKQRGTGSQAVQATGKGCKQRGKQHGRGGTGGGHDRETGGGMLGDRMVAGGMVGGKGWERLLGGAMVGDHSLPTLTWDTLLEGSPEENLCQKVPLRRTFPGGFGKGSPQENPLGKGSPQENLRGAPRLVPRLGWTRLGRDSEHRT